MSFIVEQKPGQKAIVSTGLCLANYALQSQGGVPYGAFVAVGTSQPSPWEELKHQIYLGSEALVEAMQRDQPVDTDLSEIPAV